MATRYEVDLVAKDMMGDYGYTIKPKPQGYTEKDLFMVEDTPLTHVDQQVTVEGKKYKVVGKTQKTNLKHLVVDDKYDYTYTVVPVQGGGKQKRKKQTRKHNHKTRKASRKGTKTRKGTRRV